MSLGGLFWAGLFWTILGWIDSCGDVWIEGDGGGDGFEFDLCGVAFAWGVAHGGFDIDGADGAGLGFDEASLDGCAGLEVELCGTDAALDVGGVGDDCCAGAYAHGVDFACDVEVA